LTKAWEEVGPQMWYFFQNSLQMNMIRVCYNLAGSSGRAVFHHPLFLLGEKKNNFEGLVEVQLL